MKEYSQEKVDEAIRDALEKMQTPNLLICGQTGVGKSSAVNFLFKEEVAPVNHGEPCTTDIKLYKGEAVNIYDSEGYEIGSEKQERYQRLIFDEFLKKEENQKAGGVHMVWYTISAAGKRFTDTDISIIKQIRGIPNLPMCVLLTKIDEIDEEQLKDIEGILKQELPGVKIFKLSIIDEEAVQKFCEWKKLIDWSVSELPAVFHDRFIAGLKKGLAEKQKQARIAVAMATAGSAAVAASPIPFSDAALLVPIQSVMIFRILNLYGIKIGGGTIYSLLGSLGIAALGKMIAGNLMKLIPVFGSAAGAAANVIVATVFTGAIGVTLTELCDKQAREMLDGKNVTVDIAAIFSSGEFLKTVTSRLLNKDFEKEAKEFAEEGKKHE